jgi:glycosyltransferase involved in cell wall biosynthesis
VSDRPTRFSVPVSHLRVLHVSQPTTEGVARCVSDLVHDQVAAGLDVWVACPARPWLADEVTAMGAHHIDWDARRAPHTVVGEAFRLGRSVRSLRPDIVHLHSSKAGLAGRIAVRPPTHILFQPHAWSFYGLPGIFVRTGMRWERLAARRSARILCVSVGEMEDGRAAGIPASRMIVIPNGIDLGRFCVASRGDRETARAQLGLDDSPVVLCVGRLSRQKGQDLLLDVWPEVLTSVPEANLIFVGDGPARQALEGRGHSRVTFAGNQADVRPWLAAADLVVAPSRWDGGSLATIEALSAGRPVVATAVAGVATLVAADAIVPLDDPQALQRAIVVRLLDPSIGSFEAELARQRVEDHYDIAVTSKRVRELYAEIARSSHHATKERARPTA